jgi:hypothetical protein
LRLVHDATGLTDGAGLVLIRRVWDQLALGWWIDQRTEKVGGRYRSSRLIEIWIALLIYGGGVMDDLARFAGRGIARVFGWTGIPNATTFGRWLRRGGPQMIDLLDGLCWRLVEARWATLGGVPSAVTLMLDSTVVVRYGLKQAGAEKGYNPKKQGRPSHHPLLAFTDQGDCLGIRWRGGSAHTAAGACDWLRQLIGRLRRAGVEQIIVRLDKGFFSREMVQVLDELRVVFVMKVPNHEWVRAALNPYRRSSEDPGLRTAIGHLYGNRLCSVEQRLDRDTSAPAPTEATQQRLGLGEADEETTVAHVLTNISGLQAITAWRLYNGGTIVEQRIKEFYQLGLGETAVDDLDGNAILAGLGAVAYQMVHLIRTTALEGEWRRAQPARLRDWVFRLPARFTTHARKTYVHLLRAEPLRHRFLGALRCLGGLVLPRRCAHEYG